MIGKLLRSTAFRLVVLYMALFGVSVAALLVFVYTATMREMESQMKHTINIQRADLGRKFIIDGPKETAAAIQHLIAKDTSNSFVYLLLNRRWKVLAGNLERWPGGSPKRKDWITIPFVRGNHRDGAAPMALAINSTLPGGYILLVGQSMENMEDIGQVIRRMIFISLGMTVVLGAAGGAILTWRIRHRLETVNQTCRKVMAGELQHRVVVTGSGDEFDHLAVNFNAMLGRINELIEGIRDISSNVAHDLRTPLTRLRNRLEQIEKEYRAHPDRIFPEIQQALRDIDALVGTFNAILRIAQVEGGAGIEQFQPFDLSQAVLDISDFYLPVAEEKQIRLSWDIEEHVIFTGDRHLLVQAMANLIDNAIKYTPSGGQVDIAFHKLKNMLVLTVMDTGPGIPPEFHQQVTKKFFRVEESRSTPGNGLGLSLAEAAVKLHGGHLQFINRETGGLAVNLQLPAHT